MVFPLPDCPVELFTRSGEVVVEQILSIRSNSWVALFKLTESLVEMPESADEGREREREGVRVGRIPRLASVSTSAVSTLALLIGHPS